MTNPNYIIQQNRIRQIEHEIGLLEHCLTHSYQVDIRAHLKLKLDEYYLEFKERTGRDYNEHKRKKNE